MAQNKFHRTADAILFDELTAAQNLTLANVNAFFHHAKAAVQNDGMIMGGDEIEQFRAQLGAAKARIFDDLEAHLAKLRDRYNKHLDEIPPF